MLTNLSQRLLSALQFTRMALVFTAISNAQCTLLLRAARDASTQKLPLLQVLPSRLMLAVALISIGLYGFGMSLNDIIDRRRDSAIAAHRPLPSGRIGLFTAYLICFSLIAAAILGGVAFLAHDHWQMEGWISLWLIVFTAGLITFYDFAGKYLVAPGLLTLGLIRFFHALIPAPRVPLLWHPLLLLDHVAILSAVAYCWEEKRPTLTRRHWWVVAGGLAFVNLVAIAGWWWRLASHHVPMGMWITPGLVLPGVAVIGFLVVGWRIRRTAPNSRAAGQKLMLYGLLWLILYDVAFTAAYVRVAAAAILLVFLPLAYLSVQLMRWWSNLLLLSQKPEFKRA